MEKLVTEITITYSRYHTPEHNVIFYLQVGSTFRICTEHSKVHFESGVSPNR
jgi:hypothetical protein